MFSVKADIKICTVNCVGVMGAGIALAFKRRYPKMFQDYRKACLAGQLTPGTLHFWQEGTETIINFPTKNDWKNPSEYEWIEMGLQSLALYLKRKSKAKVVIPALGCGLGGLEWKIVREMIKTHLEPLRELTIYVFNP